MIDYESFKKAIVRISVMAQDKLGVGANEDLLKEKLEREAKVKEAERLRKLDLQGQVKAGDTKRKEELAGLRQQFNEEQQKQEDLLSKANKSTAAATEESARSSTLAKQKRIEKSKYEIDAAKEQEQEKFF